MSEKLKPCPFCGNAEIKRYTISTTEDSDLYMSCDDCHAGIIGEEADSIDSEHDDYGVSQKERQVMIKKWNTRLTAQAKPETELTAGHVQSAFINGVKMAFCEIVMNDEAAVFFGKMRDGGSHFMRHVEREAFREWQRQGGPCKPQPPSRPVVDAEVCKK